MNRDLQDRIDCYILGRMSAEERVAFEQELSHNEELREQFEFTKNLKSAITSREDKLSAIREMQQQRDEAEKNNRTLTLNSKRRTKQIVAWASAIAAVLVVGLFIVTPLLIEKTGFVDNGADVMRGDDEMFEIEDTVCDTINEVDSLDVENFEVQE